MQHYTLPQNIKLRTSSHLDVFREFNFKHQKSQKICPINKKKKQKLVKSKLFQHLNEYCKAPIKLL